MKQKYVALKMYLVGLTVGMFILGWSAVANADAVHTNTGNQTASSTITHKRGRAVNSRSLRSPAFAPGRPDV